MVLYHNNRNPKTQGTFYLLMALYNLSRETEDRGQRLNWDPSYGWRLCPGFTHMAPTMAVLRRIRWVETGDRVPGGRQG